MRGTMPENNVPDHNVRDDDVHHNNDRRISDLTLEQYNLGELRPSEERRVRQLLERDGDLRSRLAEIQRSDQEIPERYPAERVVPLIRERVLRQETDAASATLAASGNPGGARRVGSSTVSRWRLPTLAWAIPVAAVVLVLLSLPIFLRPSDQTRLKGATPHLVVFRKTLSGGAEELAPGAAAKKGDVLQLGYVAADAKYGVIFSVDGRGTLTWHLPSGYRGGEMSAPALDPHGPSLLPSAYELDDAPGFERFFLVYSARPFKVADVYRVARALAAAAAGSSGEAALLRLDGGLGQSSLLVKKQG